MFHKYFGQVIGSNSTLELPVIQNSLLPLPQPLHYRPVTGIGSVVTSFMFKSLKLNAPKY
ncbi:hypothetical protein KY284_033099 [Solanum tuberosum]|nr:hypothetical protein KY284_033099 [Solanum tuberosum]